MYIKIIWCVVLLFSTLYFIMNIRPEKYFYHDCKLIVLIKLNTNLPSGVC